MQRCQIGIGLFAKIHATLSLIGVDRSPVLVIEEAEFSHVFRFAGVHRELWIRCHRKTSQASRCECQLHLPKAVLAVTGTAQTL